jgi:hypothetical protein
MRRIVKENALTFNVDAPHMDYRRRINDTKAYMIPMGLAHHVESEKDIFSSEFAAHLAAQKPYPDYQGTERLTPEFTAYLASQGVNHGSAENTPLRCKPLKGTYGCYGHVVGALSDRKFRHEFRNNLRRRGAYILQPEMAVPIVINKTDGQAYAFIDRNFFCTDGQEYQFMGGYRSLMPLDSDETRKGRNHGSRATVGAEITPG